MITLPALARRFALASLLSVAVSSCLPTEPASPQYPNPAAGKTILFIGNSLTYTNDLPLIVQGIADAAGGDSLIIATRTAGDVALIDHWEDGGAKLLIEGRSWDFVVLQQGPSSTELNRDTLRLATRLFAPSITSAGATAVLFSAWPMKSRIGDFPRAIESYRLAAEDVGGILAPVASAWATVLQNHPSVQLYSSDGLHPTLAGSYLSALVIYAAVLNHSPVGLPPSFTLRTRTQISIPAATATILQNAAWSAIQSR